jgi:hypothetical protein
MEMKRLGTCAFAHQIQEIEHVPVSHQPHLRPYVEKSPEAYTCQFFLDEELPPPLRRYNGGFEIRENDCESCAYYIPAGERLLIRLWRKKSLKGRKKRAKISP